MSFLVGIKTKKLITAQVIAKTKKKNAESFVSAADPSTD